MQNDYSEILYARVIFLTSFSRRPMDRNGALLKLKLAKTDHTGDYCLEEVIKEDFRN